MRHECFSQMFDKALETVENPGVLRTLESLFADLYAH
jgi:hypothetical protein